MSVIHNIFANFSSHNDTHGSWFTNAPNAFTVHILFRVARFALVVCRRRAPFFCTIFDLVEMHFAITKSANGSLHSDYLHKLLSYYYLISNRWKCIVCVLFWILNNPREKEMDTEQASIISTITQGKIRRNIDEMRQLVELTFATNKGLYSVWAWGGIDFLAKLQKTHGKTCHSHR